MTTKVPFEALLGFAPYMHLQYQEPQNTNGPSATAGSYETMTINTIIENGIPDASLASNQITLPEGIYYFDGVFHMQAGNSRIGFYRPRLQNITDAETLIDCIRNRCNNPTSGLVMPAWGLVSGRLDLDGEKDIEVQNEVSIGGANVYGGATNMGGNEIFGDYKIWKIG